MTLDPERSNFTLHFSPVEIVYGETNVTIWGDGTWPRPFKKGRQVTTVWYKGFPDPVYKTSQMLYCEDHDSCDFKKGQYLSGKSVCKAYIKVNNVYWNTTSKDFFGPGWYKIHTEITDYFDEEFLCLQLEVYITSNTTKHSVIQND